MTDRHHFIAGHVREGSGDDFTVVDPATGAQVSQGRVATAADVNQAVAAAKSAGAEWSRATPGERAAVLNQWACIVSQRAEDLARTESQQTGKPIKLSTEFDVPGTVDNVSFFAGAARNLEGRAAGEYRSATHTSYIRREPVACLSTSPLELPVPNGRLEDPRRRRRQHDRLKPSGRTSHAGHVRRGRPPKRGCRGRCGYGTWAATRAKHWSATPTFAWSRSRARRLSVNASWNLLRKTVKRVHLELGGKAPFVVFDDADLDAAVHGAVAGALINTGQDCTAATRAYVQRPLYDSFVQGVADLMATVRMGDPFDPGTDLGPLISRRRQRARGRFRRTGPPVREGRHWGERAGRCPGQGSLFSPTLIVDAAQDSEIVQREVFGPVLVVLPFDSDDEGISLANDSDFGLAASAWTRDLSRSMRASREIDAGCVWINDHIPIISEMPHGGARLLASVRT